jgi:hypothetical protein
VARPIRTTAAIAATGALALALATLTGCQLFVAQAPVQTPTALEACATGKTWQLDTAALQESAKVSMVERGLGVTVAVTGTQEFTWDTDFNMSFDTDLTFTGTVDGGTPGFVETYTAKGTSTGLAYLSGEIAVPRDWNEDLVVTTTATQDGAVVDPTFTWIPLWVDDTVGLRTTCTPDQLKFEARQGHLVWTFTPVA